MPVLGSFAELTRLVARRPGLYLRFSAGPEQDEGATSRDYESGLQLPGLSVNSLDHEPWWTRPLEDWLDRRLRNYVHLAEEAPARLAWVLTGIEVARGPDNEPIVVLGEAVAILDDAVLEEARRVYEERFEAGNDSLRGGRTDVR